MSIYSLLIVIIVASFTTGIITTILERKEIKAQLKKKEKTSTKKEQTQMIEILSETLEMSNLSKEVDQISVSSESIEKEYSEEPVIIAILDENGAPIK